MKNQYGVVGASHYDEETLAIQMLNKCVLNLKNAEKFIQMNQDQAKEQRMINTMQLIQELDFMLNREEENETIAQMGALFNWIIRQCEKVLEGKEKDAEAKTIQEMIPVVQNLLEGFRGRAKTMKEQENKNE